MRSSIEALESTTVALHAFREIDAVAQRLALLVEEEVALAIAVSLCAGIEQLLAQLGLATLLFGFLGVDLADVRAALLLHRLCILLHLAQPLQTHLLLARIVLLVVARSHGIGAVTRAEKVTAIVRRPGNVLRVPRTVVMRSTLPCWRSAAASRSAATPRPF